MIFEKESGFFPQHRADRYIRVKASRTADTPRPSLVERARSILAGKQIGNLPATTFATPNDTPELNALKALFGAPISMGRGEKPVELLPAAACFLPLFINFKRRLFMGKKQTSPPVIPLLKTVEQMSKISGIGENKLRELMDKGEIEYVQNGNRRLIAESAIWDWYNRNKVPAKASGGE